MKLSKNSMIQTKLFKDFRDFKIVQNNNISKTSFLF